jgi:hypothetical protein
VALWSEVQLLIAERFHPGPEQSGPFFYFSPGVSRFGKPRDRYRTRHLFAFGQKEICPESASPSDCRLPPVPALFARCIAPAFVPSARFPNLIDMRRMQIPFFQ